jgi:hypothetical protein
VVGASRRSVVSTAESLVVVLVAGMRSSNSGAGVGSVVGWANIVSRSSKTTGSNRDGTDFRVTEALGAAVALPELNAGALGVAVGRTRTVALLLLVVAGKEHLEWDGDKEEEAVVLLVCGLHENVKNDLRSNNGNSEAGSVESADGSKRRRVGDLVTLTIATKAFL